MKQEAEPVQPITSIEDLSSRLWELLEEQAIWCRHFRTITLGGDREAIQMVDVDLPETTYLAIIAKLPSNVEGLPGWIIPNVYFKPIGDPIVYPRAVPDARFKYASDPAFTLKRETSPR